MIGDASGATHRLGDRVSVRLAEAIPIAGALRFELLSDGKTESSQRRGHRGQRHRPDPARTRRPAPHHRGKRQRT
jgi:ribonuclease R